MEPVVAIDVGSGFVKAVANDGKSVVFPSHIGREPESFRESFGFEETRGLLTYQGRRWIAGEDAAVVLPSLEDTRRDEWAGSDAWIILALTALHRLGFREGHVRVAVGVPQKLWTPALYDTIVRRLARRHNLVLDGVPMDIEIISGDSMVIPQAYAGLAWIADNDEDAARAFVENGVVAGIDPGTYTTGFVVFEGGRYARHLSGGLPHVGVWAVATHVASRIERLYGLKPPVERVMSMMRTPTKVLIRREMQDIRPLMDESVREVVRPLLDHLHQLWHERAAEMDIIVYGGGASLFLPYIVAGFPHARMLETKVESQFIPAAGMLSYYMTRNGLI